MLKVERKVRLRQSVEFLLQEQVAESQLRRSNRFIYYLNQKYSALHQQ